MNRVRFRRKRRNDEAKKKKKKEEIEEKQLKEQKRAERKEHEMEAKARTQKEKKRRETPREASKQSKNIPPASIIEFMDKGDGELRNINAISGGSGKAEDGDEREGYGQAELQGLEDELDGYITGDEDAVDVRGVIDNAALTTSNIGSKNGSNSKDLNSLRTNQGLHSRDATGERPTDAVDGKQLFGLGVDELWGPNGTARKYRKQGKPRVSKSDSSRLPESLQFIHSFALKSYVEGRQDAAEAALNELIQKAPSLPDSYGLMGLIFEEKKEPEQALSMYVLESQKYRDRDKRAASWAKTAKLAVALRDSRAMFALERAQFYNKDDIEIRALKLRYMVMHTRSAEKGWAMLKGIFKLGDNDFSCYYDLGESLAMIGRGEKATLAFVIYAFHVMGRTDLLPPAALSQVLSSPHNPDHRSVYSTSGINHGS